MAAAEFANHDRTAEPIVVVGVTDTQELVTFASDVTSRGDVIGRISGLQDDTRIVGIDCRVKDSKLYGLGDPGGVYRVRSSAAGSGWRSSMRAKVREGG